METKPPPAHVFMLICVLFCHVHEVQLSILCSYTNVCCKTSVSCQYITILENDVPHIFVPATGPQAGERWNQKLSFVGFCTKTKSNQNPVWNASWIIKIKFPQEKEMNSYLGMFNWKMLVFFLKFMCLQQVLIISSSFYSDLHCLFLWFKRMKDSWLKSILLLLYSIL